MVKSRVKKKGKKSEKSYWLEILIILLVFLLLVFLRARYTGETISPYDGFMAVWR